jgi:DNA invertase Pin-like site-specific DNA recombinase
MKRSSLIPAAEYVRMSTEEQRYSIANQRQAIAEYAREHGFEIIQSYQDAGESGLSLKHRDGLRDLLANVLGGKAVYKKIIVLDVSAGDGFSTQMRPSL